MDPASGREESWAVNMAKGGILTDGESTPDYMAKDVFSMSVNELYEVVGILRAKLVDKDTDMVIVPPNVTLGKAQVAIGHKVKPLFKDFLISLSEVGCIDPKVIDKATFLATMYLEHILNISWNYKNEK